MSHPEAIKGHRRWLFPLLTILLSLLLSALIYSIFVVIRGSLFYDDLHEPPVPMRMLARGHSVGNIYTTAPDVGIVLEPNADGAWLIAKGGPVSVHHDDEGLRAPLGVKRAFQGLKHPRLLFLGDSFTYGQLVAAEDAFPYKTALKLNGESINAGTPGYGLAQMVLRARTLIPRYKPDYVVVQYSSWLVTRSQSEFFTDSSGLVMAPYFFDGKQDVGIALPLFTVPPALMSRVAKYKTSPPGLLGRAGFIAEVAFPFLVRRDVAVFALRTRQLLHLWPRPSAQHDAIIRASYAEIDQIARENGARMVVLILGMAEPPEVPSELFPPDTAGVHGWGALMQKLSVQSPDEYGRHYFLWRGEPPQMVDGHPSEEAHEVLAEAVAERIRGIEQQRH